MYAKLTVLLLLFVSWSTPSADKMYSKQYDGQGSLQAEGWIQNDVKVNYWYYYHSNGKVASEGHYENNNKSGYWQFYNKEGKVVKEGHYNQGIAENWWIFYDLATNTKQKIQYQNNQKNGFSLVYQGRKLQKVEKYVNDNHKGTWTDIRSFKRDNPEVSLY